MPYRMQRAETREPIPGVRAARFLRPRGHALRETAQRAVRIRSLHALQRGQ